MELSPLTALVNAAGTRPTGVGVLKSAMEMQQQAAMQLLASVPPPAPPPADPTGTVGRNLDVTA